MVDPKGSLASVLVVDDEEELRTMLVRHFRLLDYEVESAANGREALEKLHRSPVNVVITDIRMPEVDGVELLRALRADYPFIRSIVVTGYVTLETTLSCQRLGAERCYVKPLRDLDELTRGVEAALARQLHWASIIKELHGLKHDKE